MFGQQHDGPKDTWLTYGIFNYTMDTGYFQTDFASDLFAQLETDQYTDTESNSAVESYPQSGVHRLYSGFGLRHRCDKKQNVIFLLNYMRNSGICYTPLRNTTTNGYYRRSLLMRYQWQPKENQELSLTAERFNIQSLSGWRRAVCSSRWCWLSAAHARSGRISRRRRKKPRLLTLRAWWSS